MEDYGHCPRISSSERLIRDVLNMAACSHHWRREKQQQRRLAAVRHTAAASAAALAGDVRKRQAALQFFQGDSGHGRILGLSGRAISSDCI